MKVNLLLLTLLITCVGYTQEKGKQFTFKEVGLSITLPEGFKVLRYSQISEKNKREYKGGKESKKERHSSVPQTHLTAQKAQQNVFSVNIEPLVESDSSYQKRKEEILELTYLSMREGFPDCKVESSTTQQSIGGITFNKFMAGASKNGKATYFGVCFYKSYKGFDFVISYTYTNEETRKQIEEMLEASTFAK